MWQFSMPSIGNPISYSNPSIIHLYSVCHFLFKICGSSLIVICWCCLFCKIQLVFVILSIIDYFVSFFFKFCIPIQYTASFPKPFGPSSNSLLRLADQRTALGFANTGKGCVNWYCSTRVFEYFFTPEGEEGKWPVNLKT